MLNLISKPRCGQDSGWPLELCDGGAEMSSPSGMWPYKGVQEDEEPGEWRAGITEGNKYSSLSQRARFGQLQHLEVWCLVSICGLERDGWVWAHVVLLQQNVNVLPWTTFKAWGLCKECRQRKAYLHPCPLLGSLAICVLNWVSEFILLETA